MEKLVRISRIEEQDKIRREETCKMSGEERFLLLAKKMGTWDKPVEKIVKIRKLDFNNAGPHK